MGQFAGNGNVLLYELAILDPTPPPIPPDEQFRIIEGIMEIVMADDLAMNANSPLLFNGAIPPIDQMALKGAVKNWMDSFRAIDSQLKQIFGPTICELFFIPFLIVKFNSANAGQYNLFTLRQIQQQFTPSIDWAILLEGIDPRMNGDTKVMLKCGECFSDLDAILRRTSIELRNYLETHIILKYKFAFDGRFR
jgi:hypothetical protein